MLLKHQEGTAIKFLNQDISYSDLFSQVHLFSTLINVNKGDRVIIFSENSPGWIYSFYSVWQSSAIAVPVDYSSSAKELEYILNDCNPTVIFHSKEGKKILEEAINVSTCKPKLININDFDKRKTETNTTPLKQIDKEQTAVLIYTSGTTGSPKGVMLSFQNIQANIDGVSKYVDIYNSDRRVMILLPLHHVFPLVGSCLAPLSIGSSVAIAPSFTPNDIFETLKKHQVNIFIGVPRLYAAIRKGIIDEIEKSKIAKFMLKLAKLIQSPKLSKTLFKAVHQKFGGNIKFLISGGAALNKEIAEDFKAFGFDLLEGYGMSEASPMITFTRPGKLKVGSAGQVLNGTEIKIKRGEILSRGPHIMKGYYNKPEETADVINKEGWLHTGDLGKIDKKGRLFITGRKKEIIVFSNGKNVNPVETEFQLENAMPYVKELAVFENKDKLQLIIVPDPVIAKKLGIEDIEKYTLANALKDYNESVSSYKKIFRLYISYEELPKTRLSKVQRFKLKGLIHKPKEEQLEPYIDYRSQEYDLIKRHIEENKGVEVLPNHHIDFDLGLDSLEKVSLQVYIQNTFGVDIKAEKISDYGTLQKLSEFVNKMKTKIKEEKVNWGDIIKEKVNYKTPKSHISFWLIIKSMKVFFLSFLRYRVKGKKNIPEGPCIIVANHQSFLDGMFLASAFRTDVLRNSYFFTKAKHVKTKVAQYFAKRNNIIIVDINEDVKGAIQALANSLKKGKNIVIFPEGTRSFSDEMGEFKKTFAILSKELDVPVVPVAIKGANKVLPRGKHFPKLFKKVEVEFLKPILPKDHTYNSLTDIAKETIEQHLQNAS